MSVLLLLSNNFLLRCFWKDLIWPFFDILFITESLLWQLVNWLQPVRLLWYRMAGINIMLLNFLKLHNLVSEEQDISNQNPKPSMLKHGSAYTISCKDFESQATRRPDLNMSLASKLSFRNMENHSWVALTLIVFFVVVFRRAIFALGQYYISGENFFYKFFLCDNYCRISCKKWYVSIRESNLNEDKNCDWRCHSWLYGHLWKRQITLNLKNFIEILV